MDGDAQRISQLVWLIFLKVFDDHEREYEAIHDRYSSPLPERLRWRAWAANPEGLTGDALLEFVDGELFKTLKDLPQTGQVRVPSTLASRARPPRPGGLRALLAIGMVLPMWECTSGLWVGGQEVVDRLGEARLGHRCRATTTSPR